MKWWETLTRRGPITNWALPVWRVWMIVRHLLGSAGGSHLNPVFLDSIHSILRRLYLVTPPIAYGNSSGARLFDYRGRWPVYSIFGSRRTGSIDLKECLCHHYYSVLQNSSPQSCISDPPSHSLGFFPSKGEIGRIISNVYDPSNHKYSDAYLVDFMGIFSDT